MLRRTVLLPGVFALVAWTAGCDSIVEAIACTTENNSFTLNVNSTLTGASTTTAAVQSVTVPGSKDLPDVTVASLTVGQGDLAVSNGTGTGDLTVLVAVNGMVVAKMTAKMNNGQITQYPGTFAIGSVDGTSTILSSAATTAGMRFAANTAEAQSAVRKAIRSNSFQIGVVGHFSGTAGGTIQLSRATFNLDCD